MPVLHGRAGVVSASCEAAGRAGVVSAGCPAAGACGWLVAA